MNLMVILGVDVYQVFGMVLLCMTTILLNAFIGRHLINGCGFFTNALAGLSFNAAVITILLAFATSFAKSYTYISIVVATLYCLFFAFKVFSGKPSMHKCEKPFVLSTVLLSIVFLVTNLILVSLYVNSLNQGGADEIIFNGHQNYLSGISLEIFQADYLGRIRIFDNYPVVWSKYHFFNGSLVAQTISLLQSKNLLTYMIAKISIIALMIVVVLENCEYKTNKFKMVFAGSVLMLFVFTALSHQLWWTIFTNSFTTAFYLILSLIFLQRGRLSVAVFFILCFSLSTSRSLLPGAAILATVFFTKYYDSSDTSHIFEKIRSNAWNRVKEQSKQHLPTVLVAFVFVAAIATMLLFGESLRSTVQFNLWNFHHEGWLVFMSPALTSSDELMRSSDLYIVHQTPLWYAFWLVAMIWVLFSGVSVESLKQKIKTVDALRLGTEIARNYRNYFLLALVAALVIAAVVLINSYKARLYILYLVMYFVVPMVLAVSLAPTKLKLYVAVFCFVALLQVVIFNPDISLPNFASIEWLVLYGFIVKLVEKELVLGVQTTLFAICFMVLILAKGLSLDPKNLFGLNWLDSCTKAIPINSDTANLTSSNQGSAFCYAGSDEAAALAALSGIRVTYSADKNDRYSVSKLFSKPTDQDISEIGRLCPTR